MSSPQSDDSGTRCRAGWTRARRGLEQRRRHKATAAAGASSFAGPIKAAAVDIDVRLGGLATTLKSAAPAARRAMNFPPRCLSEFSGLLCWRLV